jgi:hypothetical protein
MICLYYCLYSVSCQNFVLLISWLSFQKTELIFSSVILHATPSSQLASHSLQDCSIMTRTTLCNFRGAHKGGGASGLQSHQAPRNQNLKTQIRYYDIKLLRDLPFNWNQQLKSADDYYIRILKNKLITLKKNKKTRHCDCVMECVVIFVCI